MKERCNVTQNSAAKVNGESLPKFVSTGFDEPGLNAVAAGSFWILDLGGCILRWSVKGEFAALWHEFEMLKRRQVTRTDSFLTYYFHLVCAHPHFSVPPFWDGTAARLSFISLGFLSFQPRHPPSTIVIFGVILQFRSNNLHFWCYAF